MTDSSGRELVSTDGRPKFVLDAATAEPRGYLAAIQARDGMIHMISSRNHYAFNLKWLERNSGSLR